MNNSLIIVLLLIVQLANAKSVVKNDTLLKLNFDDLRLKLVGNIDNKKLFKIYADYYISKAKKLNDIENQVKGYGFKVEEYPFKEALKNADSMLYLVKNKAPKLFYLYYYKMGNLYSGNRMNIKALESYLIAYKSCDKNNEIHYNAIKMQIGVIRSALGQYQDAITILKETENYFKTKSPSHYLFQQYIMAEAYNSLLELETAKGIIDRGIILSKNQNFRLMYDRFKTMEGVNLYYRKEYNNTLSILLPILKDANYIKEDFSDYAFVSYYIGKSYEGQKNKNLALKYFKKVDSIFIKHNDIYIWNIDSYKFLIDFYKDKKDLQNQLVYTERLIKADSLLMASNEYSLKKLNKEYDIPNLISEKQAVINELEKKELFSKFLIVLLSTTITVLAFLFYRNRKKNKEKIEFLKTDLEKYLSIQNKHFEDKNKFSILESIISSTTNESQGKMSNLAKDNILSCLELFEKNKDFLNNNCSLENLSKDFNTNKTYLSKIINDEKGYSFSTYISNLRIEYVVQLLKEDKKIRKYSIESISEEVGYNNAKAFSKAFYERIAMKPSVFIKNI